MKNNVEFAVLRPFHCGGCIWRIPEIPHNGTVEYKGILFGQWDGDDDHPEMRSMMPADALVLMLA